MTFRVGMKVVCDNRGVAGLLAVGDCNEDNQPWACLTDDEGKDYAATGTTPIIALCIAAMKARSLT